MRSMITNAWIGRQIGIAAGLTPPLVVTSRYDPQGNTEVIHVCGTNDFGRMLILPAAELDRLTAMQPSAVKAWIAERVAR